MDCAPCSTDGDCNDDEFCTTDVCSDGACSYTFATCGAEDECCGPDCNFGNDPDCQSEPCGDGVCAGNGEDCFSCPADCRCAGRSCNACCGDGICGGNGEKANNCPVDCGG